MYEKLKSLLQEHIIKAPRANQLAINSFDWTMTCHTIGEKFNLTDEELSGLITEVGLVLVGLSDSDTLNTYLVEKIGGVNWEKLRDEIYVSVFERMGWLIEMIDKYDIRHQTLFYFEDIYALDLPVLLEKSNLSSTRPIGDCGLVMKYYDSALDRTYLNCFDRLRIGIVWEDKVIKIDPQSLDITLLPRIKKLTKNQISFMLDSIFKSCESIPDQAYGLSDIWRFLEGECSFILLDHPNGHDIGISQNDDIGFSVNINIGYDDFLKFRKKYCSL